MNDNALQKRLPSLYKKYSLYKLSVGLNLLNQEKRMRIYVKEKPNGKREKRSWSFLGETERLRQLGKRRGVRKTLEISERVLKFCLTILIERKKRTTCNLIPSIFLFFFLILVVGLIKGIVLNKLFSKY